MARNGGGADLNVDLLWSLDGTFRTLQPPRGPTRLRKVLILAVHFDKVGVESIGKHKFYKFL